MPLTIVQYEEIVALLLEIPALVDELEGRHAGVYEDALEWMRRAENVTESNRLPACSQIAAYRAQLVEAARGVYPDNLRFVGRPSLRKIKDASVALLVSRAEDVLQGAIADRQKVFDEAQRIAQQLVAVARSKGLLDTDAAAGADDPQTLRDTIESDPDIGRGYVHLVGLVGTSDALILLDRSRTIVA